MQSSIALMFLLLVCIYSLADGAATRRYNLAGQPMAKPDMMSELNYLLRQAEQLKDDRMHGMGMDMSEEDKNLVRDEIAELRRMADDMPLVHDEEVEGGSPTPGYSPALRNTLKKIRDVTSTIDSTLSSLPSTRDILGPDDEETNEKVKSKFKRWVHKVRSFVYRAVGEPGSEQREDVVTTAKAVANLSFRVLRLFI